MVARVRSFPLDLVTCQYTRAPHALLQQRWPLLASVILVILRAVRQDIYLLISVWHVQLLALLIIKVSIVYQHARTLCMLLQERKYAEII